MELSKKKNVSSLIHFPDVQIKVYFGEFLKERQKQNFINYIYFSKKIKKFDSIRQVVFEATTSQTLPKIQ